MMTRKIADPSLQRRRNTRSGFSLPSVLILMAIALTAGLAIAASGTVTLNLSSRHAQTQKALCLAEAAINQAIYRLEGDASWGKSTPAELKVDFGPSSDSDYARITFDRNAKSPYSLNNFGNSSADSNGWGGRVVPPNTVCITAVAQVGSCKRTVEVLLNRPPFPYALAASGYIRSGTPLVVQGVENLQAYMEAQEGSLDSSKERPGNLAANSTDSLRAIFLPTNSYITGNTKATGGILYEPPVTVKGGINPYTPATALPKVDIASFNPKMLEGVGNLLGDVNTTTTLADSTYTNLPHLDGVYYAPGDLTINGDLNLSNSVLYVEGNLTVTGAALGTGAVFVMKNTGILKGASLAAGNQIALFGKGDVTLSGQNNAFQGLVYTEGTLTANQMTVVGVVVANGSGETGNIDLQNSKIVYNQEAARITLSRPIANNNNNNNTTNNTTTNSSATNTNGNIARGNDPFAGTDVLQPGMYRFFAWGVDPANPDIEDNELIVPPGGMTAVDARAKIDKVVMTEAAKEKNPPVPVGSTIGLKVWDPNGNLVTVNYTLGDWYQQNIQVGTVSSNPAPTGGAQITDPAPTVGATITDPGLYSNLDLVNRFMTQFNTWRILMWKEH